MVKKAVLFVGSGVVSGFHVPGSGINDMTRARGGRRPTPHMAVDPTIVSHAVDVLHMPSLTMSAITGSTCVDDSGWWCTVQNSVEGLIENLHGVVSGPLGVKENSYGWSIILFTFMCRAAIFPLTFLSYQSSDRVKALKPYMDQIKERYGDDQQAANLAVAKLYEMTETNPLAGCLPSIAQIPVFIALYRSVLNLAFANKLDEPFFWLPSLEGPTYDAGRGIAWLTDNWVDGVPPLGWHDTAAFCALPIALVLTQSLSMRVMTPPADPGDVAAQRTQRVLKYLPLLIGWFSANVPAGLGLYWMTSNLFTVTSSVAAKAYLKENPVQLDINFAQLGLDDGSAGVKIPTSIEDAIKQAKVNAAPSRLPRRAGVPPIAFFDLGTADENLHHFPSTLFDLEVPSSSLSSSSSSTAPTSDDELHVIDGSTHEDELGRPITILGGDQQPAETEGPVAAR